MDLSVIVVNYRTPDLSVNCIRSIHKALFESGIDYEVVLVDNCSNDGQLERLKELEDENTTVVVTERNGGFGFGNNRGVENAKGEYLFFLNSDTILYPDTLPQMLDYLKKNETVAVVGCLMRDGDNAPLVSYHPFENTKSLFIQTFIKPFVPTFIKKIRGERYVRLEDDAPTKCDWVSGAAMLMPRKIFTQLGGWNERYFMYMEDEELCLKAKQSGYEVVVMNSFGLQHLVGRSGGSYFSALERYKSKLCFFKENYPGMYWLNKHVLIVQAMLYMNNLPAKERNAVLRELRRISNK